MTRTYRSAGAIVVSADPADATALLLEQVHGPGERQVVAPKGTIEPGESPLATATREVQEEAGLANPTYVGFLGRQHYGFTDRDGTEATKSVDWFLFASDSQDVTPMAREGFVGAEWIPLERAAQVASHASFGPYIERARGIVTWRQPGRLAYSADLSKIVWAIADEAACLLRDTLNAGVGLCGSAARGDFVDGWSDIDLIGWGIDPTSIIATRLMDLARSVEQETGIHASVRVADSSGRDATGAGPLYDMKLRAVLSRGAVDLPVIAGTQPPTITPLGRKCLVENIEALRDFAAAKLTAPPTTEYERRDRARRVLSVMCSAARNVATSYDAYASLRLPDVASLVGWRLPEADILSLLIDYDSFRQAGANDLRRADALAERVPDVLDDLIRRAPSSEGPDAPTSESNPAGRE